MRCEVKNVLEFDHKKATQAVNFLATQEDSLHMKKINKMKAIKLIWIADRYHLRKYGRPVIGDDYKAMPLGPVGSAVRDILIQNSFSLAQEELDYSRNFIESVNQYVVRSTSEPDLSVFSKTDVEALKFAFDNFGFMNQFQLKDFSHLYPEWKKFETKFQSKLTFREDMSYIDFFDNPENMPDDKFAEDEQDLELNKKIFIEESNINSQLL
jgi:uncharacterized phage-associated protein